MQSPPFNHPTPYAQPHSTPQTAPPQTASTVGAVVVAVPGAWGYRIVVEVALAAALLFSFAGMPQAVLAALILLPGLALTRKMLVLDPRTRRARGASVVRWLTNGPEVPFDALRPWVHRTKEVTRWRRQSGSVNTETAVRSMLHLTPTDRTAFAQTTSLFHGYDRFAAVTLNLVGAPVDPAALSAALAGERIRLWSRAVVTSLITVALTGLLYLLIKGRGEPWYIAPALFFVALSADRWWAVFTLPLLAAPRVPLGRARVASLLAHGVATVVVIASVPAALAARAAHDEESRERYSQLAATHEAAAQQELTNRPATGSVAPVVATLPARASGAVDEASVRERLTAVGFRVRSPNHPRSSFTWSLEASPGASVTVDVSLRPASDANTTGQMVGTTWVAVRYSDPAERASVLRFIEGRQDTSDATLASALRSVGVARVTGRAGKAWGWIGRAEFTADAVTLDEQSTITSRACTIATEGLLCAEVNRTIYRGDPNWTRYALAVAAGATR
jgi:hypothetical protein